jgi:riboflavin kinase/FMN adenylyltransferase
MPEPRVVEGLAAVDRHLGRLFAVVGVFDGLHTGHAYLIRTLLHEARSRDARPAVITFDHHPDEIIRGAAPPVLVDPAERIARLGDAGVDVVLVMHFDEKLRRTSYDDFVDALRERVELAGFLMTSESAFGHERRGTPEALDRLGRDRGFDVVVVEPLKVDGEPIRSTTIRAAIARGELDLARRLLGRPVAVTGEVARGERRRVSFPLPVALPPDGPYRALVGEPIDRGSNPAFPPRRRVVSVSSGEIELASAAPGEPRVRIAFRAHDGRSTSGERSRPLLPSQRLNSRRMG